MADAAKRSLDAVRFIDGLLVGLIATQSAILAIVLEIMKSKDSFPKWFVWWMDWALVVAALTLLLTLWAQEAPDARGFRKIFPQKPGGTREDTIVIFERVSERNLSLLTWKLGLFIACLLSTLTDILVKTQFHPLQWGGGS